MQKNKVHTRVKLLSTFTVFYVYVIKGNTDKSICFQCMYINLTPAEFKLFLVFKVH